MPHVEDTLPPTSSLSRVGEEQTVPLVLYLPQGVETVAYVARVSSVLRWIVHWTEGALGTASYVGAIESAAHVVGWTFLAAAQSLPCVR